MGSALVSHAELGCDAFGHDHKPGVGDELTSLTEAQHRDAGVDPVVALVTATFEEEPMRLGGDERRAFFPGKPKPRIVSSGETVA